jgi:hypothetical protein
MFTVAENDLSDGAFDSQARAPDSVFAKNSPRWDATRELS